MYTHRSTYLHTMAEVMTDTMGLSARDSACAVVPMFHAMGWGLPFAATMLGAKQAMPHRFMAPEPLTGLIASEGVTVSAGVPTIWQGVRAHLEAEPGRYDLSALDRLVCGGSAPPVSLIRWYWDVHRIEMIHAWGMTEMNPSERCRGGSRSAPTSLSTRTRGSPTSPRRGSSPPGWR